MGGGKGGGGGSGDLMNAANAQIEAANAAAQVSMQYADKSIAVLQDMYNTTTKSITDYFNFGMNQVAPYNWAGLSALDEYMKSTGMPTVQGGSFNLQQALQRNNVYQYQLQGYNEALKAYESGMPVAVNAQNNYNPYNTMTFPIAQSNPNFMKNTLSADSFVRELQGIFNGGANDFFNPSIMPGYLNYWGVGGGMTGMNAKQLYQNSQDYLALIGGMGSSDMNGDTVGASGLNRKNSKAQQLQALLDKYGGFKDPTKPDEIENPLTEEQKAMVQGYQDGHVPTTPTTDSLAGFTNSGFGRLMGFNSQDDMITNFSRNNPGYDFQMQQGQQAIQKSAASKGMLNNPNMLTALDEYTTGLANQSFIQYQQGLMGAFGNYQNSLAGLMGAGLSSNMQSQVQAGNAGAGIGNASMQNGQNQAGVYTNLGNTLANSELAKGNAMANYYTQKAAMSQQSGGGLGQLFGLAGNLLGGGGMLGNIGSGMSGSLGLFL